MWRASPEGFDFWDHVDDHYRYGRDLPPLPGGASAPAKAETKTTTTSVDPYLPFKEALKAGKKIEFRWTAVHRWEALQDQDYVWSLKPECYRIVEPAPQPVWHNPENVPADKVPQGWRFCIKEEVDGRHAGKGRLWFHYDYGFFKETNNNCNNLGYTYIVPDSIPLPGPGPGQEKIVEKAVPTPYRPKAGDHYQSRDSGGDWSHTKVASQDYGPDLLHDEYRQVGSSSVKQSPTETKPATQPATQPDLNTNTNAITYMNQNTSACASTESIPAIQMPRLKSRWLILNRDGSGSYPAKVTSVGEQGVCVLNQSGERVHISADNWRQRNPIPLSRREIRQQAKANKKTGAMVLTGGSGYAGYADCVGLLAQLAPAPKKKSFIRRFTVGTIKKTLAYGSAYVLGGLTFWKVAVPVAVSVGAVVWSYVSKFLGQ
jgi:hypothetical protein